MRQDDLIEQVDAVLADYREVASGAKYDDLSDLAISNTFRLFTRASAVVERIAGSSSPYAKQLAWILDQNSTPGKKVGPAIGVLESLRVDLESGYLQSVSELLHAEVFSDFLEMAQHLVDNGYKDAAAVVVGSSLEAHLRQLCAKFNVETEVQSGGNLRPKKADQMNSELAKANAYSKLDQKSVTAWLDLRNKAAHGEYRKYSEDQVGLMLSGVRDFLVRHPA